MEAASEDVAHVKHDGHQPEDAQIVQVLEHVVLVSLEEAHDLKQPQELHETEQAEQLEQTQELPGAVTLAVLRGTSTL